MRFLTTTLLLLAALLTICLAKPIPLARLDDIERRWSQGESEVCIPNLSGCYVLAWIRSLSRVGISVRRHSSLHISHKVSRIGLANDSQSSIHAAHSYRDATPAWPVVRDSLDEVSWDERSAAVRKRKRSAQGDVSRLKAFVEKFYRKMGMEQRAKEVNDVPVLKPKRGMKYPFAA